MIDKHREILYNILGVAAVAQSVERRIGSAEVTGPIPVSSFKIKTLYFSGDHKNRINTGFLNCFVK